MQIYRTEYKTGGQGMGTTTFDLMQDREVPCVVCQNPPGQEYSLMIPGQPRCPPGFNLDYRGYLMGSWWALQRMTYTCLDELPEGLNLQTSDGGASIYFTQPHDLPFAGQDWVLRGVLGEDEGVSQYLAYP